MQAIVAIGGGELGKGETRPIDEYIVSLCDKDFPEVIFLPTASHDAPAYIDAFIQAYTALGCKVRTLCLWSDERSSEEIAADILSADIVYVGGGSTQDMMTQWKKHGVDQALREAYRRGVILSGLSAGSVCWFRSGWCDTADGAGMEWVDGLDIIHCSHAPHYETEAYRTFDDALVCHDTIGIALEGLTALSVIDGHMQVIRADENRKAYLLRVADGASFRTQYDGGYID